MEYVVEFLRKEREAIVMYLKNGEQEKVRDLQQIDQAMGWLKLIQDNGLDTAGKYNLDALPYIEGCGGFRSCRKISDATCAGYFFEDVCQKT